MTITVAAWPRFVPRSDTSDLTAMIVRVTDTAGPTPIEIAVVNANTGAPGPLTGWTGAGNTTGGGLSNDYQINVPMGGPWTPGVRVAGGPCVYAMGPGALLGDVRLYAGQSNASNMRDVISGSYTANPNTAMYVPGTGWTTTTGDGLINLTSQLCMVGVPQAILAVAKGSTALTLDGFYYTSQAIGAQAGFWLDTTGSLWSGLTDTIAALANPLTPGAGSIAGMIWDQGESDSIVGISSALYERGLSMLWERVQALVPRKVPSLRIAVIPTGYYNPSPVASGYAVDPRPVIEAQHRFVRKRPEAYIVDRYDLPRDSSNIHLTAPGYVELGYRLAWADARKEYGM